MTGRIEKTVFISYRRANKPWALFIYQNLTNHGYDVFIDFQNINSGNFATAILNNIKARAHFVLILTPSSLERCKEPGDWLRREIETAMDEKRNIVPLMVESFDFGSPLVKNALTGKLSVLSNINGLTIPDDYPFEAMDRLRERFLNISLTDVALPSLPEETQEITRAEKSAANEAAPVREEELTAQKWFERGYVFHEGENYDEAIRSYTETINLEPNFADAFRNRGDCFKIKGNYEDAIKDYDKAVHLYSKESRFVTKRARAHFRTRKPKTRYSDDFLKKMADHLKTNSILKLDLAEVYFGRAISHQLLGNLKNALKDYEKSIQHYPHFFGYFFMRGSARRESNDLKGAIADLQKTINLNPDFADAHYDSACIEAIRGNKGKALRILGVAIEKKSDYKEKARQDPDFENIRDDPRFKELVGE